MTSTTHARIAYLACITRELASSMRMTPPGSLAEELRLRAKYCEHLDMIAARLDVLEGEVLVSESRASVQPPARLGWPRKAVFLALAVAGVAAMFLRLGCL